MSEETLLLRLEKAVEAKQGRHRRSSSAPEDDAILDHVRIDEAVKDEGARIDGVKPIIQRRGRGHG